jgi:hypothetical protein
MKRFMLVLSLFIVLCTLSSCGRKMRTAEDITPGNRGGEKLDWRYGANDIKIQTCKITSQLMDRWFEKTGYNWADGCKPRIVITQIDNRTDCYISTDMIRDIIEGAAIDDGRFTVVVGDTQDEKDLDKFLKKIENDPKYAASSKPSTNRVTAPQFIGKIRITKAINSDRHFDYEDYRMTVTLYDIETQEAIDSAWDVLSKRVKI